MIEELPFEETKTVQIEELLQRNEDQTLEFKATLRYDLITHNVNKELEKACLKEVCGFMNADGGTVLVGVSDDKKIEGLERYYKTLPKNNWDVFQNHLINLIESKIGNFFQKFILYEFPKLEGKEICQITVFHSTEPAYYEKGLNQQFFVRFGNSTRELSVEEANKYIQERWNQK